jgi:hypothetical protein
MLAGRYAVRVEGDDRRPCRQCTNLAGNGRCLAAWRGELRPIAEPGRLYVFGRSYSPVPDMPHRCEAFQERAST